MSSDEHVFSSPCSFIDYEMTGIDPKEETITFVSRLVNQKGLSLFIPAIPEILNKHPEVTIKIIGLGFREEEIRNKLEKFIADGSVTIGFEPEPIKILRKSLIFLSLQKRENYPSQSLIEAMACGNAIIATDVGLTRKLVNDQVGLLIDRNKDSLVSALDVLLKNRNKTKEFGEAARKFVLENHTAHRFWEYLLKVYTV